MVGAGGNLPLGQACHSPGHLSATCAQVAQLKLREVVLDAHMTQLKKLKEINERWLGIWGWMGWGAYPLVPQGGQRQTHTRGEGLLLP